jgi:hypothetical protein
MGSVGERELLCGETVGGCEVMEEGVALCDMVVPADSFCVYRIIVYKRAIPPCSLTKHLTGIGTFSILLDYFSLSGGKHSF